MLSRRSLHIYASILADFAAKDGYYNRAALDFLSAGLARVMLVSDGMEHTGSQAEQAGYARLVLNMAVRDAAVELAEPLMRLMAQRAADIVRSYVNNWEVPELLRDLPEHSMLKKVGAPLPWPAIIVPPPAVPVESNTDRPLPPLPGSPPPSTRPSAELQRRARVNKGGRGSPPRLPPKQLSPKLVPGPKWPPAPAPAFTTTKVASAPPQLPRLDTQIPTALLKSGPAKVVPKPVIVVSPPTPEPQVPEPQVSEPQVAKPQVAKPKPAPIPAPKLQIDTTTFESIDWEIVLPFAKTSAGSRGRSKKHRNAPLPGPSRLRNSITLEDATLIAAH